MAVTEEPARLSNRSSEELMMRATVETWGRARWPDARVVHELVVGECRIDMAFICPKDLIGVEIKSSKDKLDRLDRQMQQFSACIPEVWLAIAPKWEAKDLWRHSNRLTIGPGGIENNYWSNVPGRRDELCLSRMLEMLWADEARRIASRKSVSHAPRLPLYKVKPLLARYLTGNEILEEVCRELRARHQGVTDTAFWKADPPISDSPK